MNSDCVSVLVFQLHVLNGLYIIHKHVLEFMQIKFLINIENLSDLSIHDVSSKPYWIGEVLETIEW